MKLLGLSVQKPANRQAWQQHPALVRTWETEASPAIRAQAKRKGARIYFADESGMRSDYHADTTWAPVGETSVVAVTGRRFFVKMISTVSSQGEFRLMLNEGAVTAGVFVEFLQRLLVGMDKSVFMVVNGHQAHKSRFVRDFVEK
jgi:hypothetical protein